jgi:hypothetical protein
MNSHAKPERNPENHLQSKTTLPTGSRPTQRGSHTTMNQIQTFIEKLKINPNLPRPEQPEGIPITEASRLWKSQCRAYDYARIKLGIKTPHEVQIENSIFVGFPTCEPKISGINVPPPKQK